MLISRVLLALSSRMFFLLLLLIFLFGNTSSKIAKPKDNETPWATMGKLYRIGRFYNSYGKGADSKNIERLDKKIDDVKENFINLVEDIRDIRNTIEIYHEPKDTKGNSSIDQSSGNFIDSSRYHLGIIQIKSKCSIPYFSTQLWENDLGVVQMKVQNCC